MSYCLKCGTKLESHMVDGRLREVCENCGWIHYLQLKVGVGVFVEKDDLLLLLRRAYEPWQGYWNLPAGYVEADESPSDAAKREALEETGLEVEVGKLVNMYYFDDDPRGNGIMFVYHAESVTGQININNEVHTAQCFAWQDIPENLAGGGHDKAILDWHMAAQKKYGNE